jgi:PTS system mannitol-specific IIC component
MSNIIAGDANATGWRSATQKFGGFLAGMVIPNIGAFIAWGLLTALFIPTGWIPNADLATLVGPMILNLLPLLIAYTGGRLVHGQRGAVIGAIAGIGVIVGTSIPMFLGAMIVGPLAAWLLKQLDKVLDPITPSGFEMLIGNFSLGILGLGSALGAYKGIGPVVTWISDRLGEMVGNLVSSHLLPLLSIIVEPAKVLFLNNAINHGVLAPLGVQQAATEGKSILFMIESNPGPGLGILVAFWLFGPKVLRGSVPGAIVIHFLGGIHEIYFPYILMRPIMIVAAILGGMTGVTTFMLLGAGLVATPSPGSIFAYFAMTPKDGYFQMITGVLLSAVVSFLVGSFLLRLSKAGSDDLEAATATSKKLKKA